MFQKQNRTKRHIGKTINIICVCIAIYALYILLLDDDLIPFSIGSVLAEISHWTRNWHALAIGLIPIYVALMIFGTTMLGIYFGSKIQRWLSQCWHQKHH